MDDIKNIQKEITSTENIYQQDLANFRQKKNEVLKHFGSTFISGMEEIDFPVKINVTNFGDGKEYNYDNYGTNGQPQGSFLYSDSNENWVKVEPSGNFTNFSDFAEACQSKILMDSSGTNFMGVGVDPNDPSNNKFKCFRTKDSSLNNIDDIINSGPTYGNAQLPCYNNKDCSDDLNKKSFQGIFKDNKINVSQIIYELPNTQDSWNLNNKNNNNYYSKNSPNLPDTLYLSRDGGLYFFNWGQLKKQFLMTLPMEDNNIVKFTQNNKDRNEWFQNFFYNKDGNPNQQKLIT